MLKKLSIITSILFISACGKEAPKEGIWRGTINTQGQEIPFNFELNKISNKFHQVILINGEERFTIDSVVVDNDSLYLPFDLFDGFIKAKTEKNNLEGHYVKRYAVDYELPFHAEFGKNYRFIENPNAIVDVSGKWQIEFNEGGKLSPAVGVFEQEESIVTGTFVINSGDYRFLEGSVDDDSLYLSKFDGTNAYLFKAKVNGEKLEGEFFSGKSGYKTWTGTKNEAASLEDPDNLTFLKDGYTTLDFTFPNLNGEPVSLSDDRFENKVVIVQLLGSWCINCMDETRFLAKWYQENKEKPIEIVGLAFERKDDILYAKQQLSRHIERFNVQYPILFAGANNKETKMKALPMLENFSAFPTTIFLDRNKNVRKIHTGFSGPGTGEYYDQFVKEFNEFVEKLIKEEKENPST